MIGETPPEKSERSLKTGFLVSAFKDSDDMIGMKSNTRNEDEASKYVSWYLSLGYQTVLVENRS